MSQAIKERRGLLDKDSLRQPKLPFAVQLFRTEPTFRALVELALVGLVTLLFATKFDWKSVSSSASQPAPAAHPLSSALQTATAPNFGSLTTGRTSPGSLSIDAAISTNLTDQQIADASILLRPKLDSLRTSLMLAAPETAIETLSGLDPSSPIVSYAKALAILHLPGPGRGIDALRELRSATSAGYAPAFTMTGIVLFRLVYLYERSQLPSDQLATIDGAGNTLSATPRELAQEAVQWWERAAAMNSAVALRMLGAAEAYGLLGRKNLPAAISHWREAARLGDAPARTELGTLHLTGSGIEQDTDKAISYLRDAVDQDYLPAHLSLATALLTSAKKDDLGTYKEAVHVAEKVIRAADDPSMAGLAHLILGLTFSAAVPDGLRNQERAVAHFHAAYALDMPLAASALTRAYESGVGAPLDRAYAAALADRDALSSSTRKSQQKAKLSTEESERYNSISASPLPLPLAAVSELRAAQLPDGSFGKRSLYGKPAESLKLPDIHYLPNTFNEADTPLTGRTTTSAP